MPERYRPHNLPREILREATKSSEHEPPPPSPFYEGKPKKVLPLETIQYDDGSSLVFSQIENPIKIVTANDELVTHCEYNATYKQNDGKVFDLNHVLSKYHKIHYVGADSFWAFDAQPGDSGPSRDTVIALSGEQLKDKRIMIAIGHELGHAYLYEGMDESLYRAFTADSKEAQKLINKPDLGNIKPYFKHLFELSDKLGVETPSELKKIYNEWILGNSQPNIRTQLHETQDKYPEFRVVRDIFHERLAWAFAFNLTRKFGLDLGYQNNKEMANYAEECLGTYVNGYQDSRFITGIGKDKLFGLLKFDDLR